MNCREKLNGISLSLISSRMHNKNTAATNKVCTHSVEKRKEMKYIFYQSNTIYKTLWAQLRDTRRILSRVQAEIWPIAVDMSTCD